MWQFENATERCLQTVNANRQTWRIKLSAVSIGDKQTHRCLKASSVATRRRLRSGIEGSGGHPIRGIVRYGAGGAWRRGRVPVTSRHSAPLLTASSAACGGEAYPAPKNAPGYTTELGKITRVRLTGWPPHLYTSSDSKLEQGGLQLWLRAVVYLSHPRRETCGPFHVDGISRQVGVLLGSLPTHTPRRALFARDPVQIARETGAK